MRTVRAAVDPPNADAPSRSMALAIHQLYAHGFDSHVATGHVGGDTAIDTAAIKQVDVI